MFSKIVANTADDGVRHIENLLRLLDLDGWEEEVFPVVEAYILHAAGEGLDADQQNYLEKAMRFLATGMS